MELSFQNSKVGLLKSCKWLILGTFHRFPFPNCDQTAEVLPKSAPTLHLMELTISHLRGYASISTQWMWAYDRHYGSYAL